MKIPPRREELEELVSVIVPVYNSEEYLEACINSILGQTHKNLELILINDGSEDLSLRICRYFEEIDERVRVIDKKNAGVSAARNDGITASRGVYIGFVDSDDVIDEDLYEKMVGLLSKDSSQCAVLSSYTINKANEVRFKEEGTITNQEAINFLFNLRFPTSLWAYLYKKEVIGGVRLREDIHFFEDLEFNFRVLTNCKSVSLCPEKLYYYRLNPSSINYQGANPKRLTCLLISKHVRRELLGAKNRKGLRKFCYLECYFIISSLAPLRSPLSEYEIEYGEVVRHRVKNVWPRLMMSRYVPFKNKIFLLFIILHVSFAVRCWGVLRGRK